MKPEWHIGAEANTEYVFPTDNFFKGANKENKHITASTGATLRAGFSFNPESKEGILYPGLYQGVALGIRTFYHDNLLGTPGSAYAFQGAPIARMGNRFHLDYEWNFGIAFGWKHNGYIPIETSSVISTAVTAHMGVALKFRYDLTDNWTLSFGLGGTHFSNGNTSWRNAGLNSGGINIGIDYTINPLPTSTEEYLTLKEEADKKRWIYDIMAFGAWRQRLVYLGNPEIEYLAPGKYPVLGVQFAPAIKLNRWVAVGPALDLQWDKSADLSRYWINDGNMTDLKFRHVPVEKQISVGISAHAELTAPIFSVNAGIGYNVINPKGDRAFYQSLTVKVFFTKNLYLNVGYRLGAFKDPHNIMLGIGYRI
ncbi:MAG: acyloxyacyl hydrolase [Muribaculaceae bacterium]|nr:acyloxyacyl hydrolase [Muribaculaceae bacterium]